MSEYSEKLKLENVSGADEKMCRDAFAKLPESVQKLITDNGISFTFDKSSSVYNKPERDGALISTAWLEDARTDPDTLPALFLGHGLALSLIAPPPQLLQDAFTEQFIHAYIFKKQIPADPAKPLLKQLTPAQLSDYKRQLQDFTTKHNATDKMADILQGGYRSHVFKASGQEDGLPSGPVDQLYEYALAEAERITRGESLKNEFIIKAPSPQDEERCRNALATLPMYLQKIITDVPVEFNLTSDKDTGTQISQGKILMYIDSLYRDRGPRNLAATLGGYALAAASTSKGNAIPVGTIVRAMIDQNKDMEGFLKELHGDTDAVRAVVKDMHISYSSADRKMADELRHIHIGGMLSWYLEGNAHGAHLQHNVRSTIYEPFLADPATVRATEDRALSKSLLIEGGSPANEAKCREAFAKLPEHVRKAVVDAKIRFILPRPGSEGSGSISIKGSAVVFSSVSSFTPDELMATIGGYGLSAAMGNSVPGGIFQPAFEEHAADIKSKFGSNGPGRDLDSEEGRKKYTDTYRLDTIGALLQWKLQGVERVGTNPTEAREFLYEWLKLQVDRKMLPGQPVRTLPPKASHEQSPKPAPDPAEEARKEAERLRLAEEEAKKPKPYPVGLTGEHTLVKDEIVPLAAMLDCRFESHQALGDALLNAYVLEIADNYAKGYEGVVRSLMTQGKNPGHVKALEEAKKAVEQLFTPHEIPEAEREATEAVKTQLLQSPVLLAMFLNKQRVMDSALQWQGADEKNLYVMDEQSGLLRKHWPEMEKLLLPPLPEKKVEPPPPPPPPPAPEPEPAPVPEIVAPVVAAATVVAVTPEPVAPPPEPEPVIPPPVPKPLREQAFEAARSAALSHAEDYLLQAYEEGYRQFQCSIDLKAEGFPITLSFVNAAGEAKKLTLLDHAQEFAKRGVTMTLEEAVDLKIAVQSKILNEKEIEPYRDPNNSGETGVKLDHVLPAYTRDPATRKMNLHSNGGVLSLELAPLSGDAPPVSIALGQADEPQNWLKPDERKWIDGKAEKPAEVSETAERVKLIMDFIEAHGKEVRWVTKRDVVDKLDRYVTTHGKEWVSPQTLPLPGYEEAKLIHIVSDASGAPTQKITLAPVSMRMDPGGDNPSWHLDFTLYANNHPQDSSYGDALRSRSVNLHTSSKELAFARAYESMNSFKDGSMPVTGFVDALKAYAAEHPRDRWVRIGSEHSDQGTVMIGPKHLQDFLDDMHRYEDDVGVKLVKSPAQDGRVTFTLFATRAETHDLRKTAKADPRVICIKDGDMNRKPVEITLTVPEAMAGKIDAFADKIKRDMRYAAMDAYSSVALSDDPAKMGKRKKVQKYNCATIKNMMEGAISSNHAAFFGTPFKGARKSYAEIHAAAQPQTGASAAL